MTVNSITPDLVVEDVETTVDWYERVFDAEPVATLPTDGETDPSWAQVMVGDSALMFQERESLAEKLPVLKGATIGGSVPLYVDTDDAEDLYADLDAAGVEVVKSPHTTDFGWRQFAVLDCNGNVLWFGEKLETEETEDIGRRERTYHPRVADTAADEGRGGRQSPRMTGNEHWG
ncbi:hypothetical protein BRC95_04275 [Halobacteriales archaeon QS_5_68_33]|nr:MAG: hypothetical protein BRC95_04275 [Halobacteriales archaeon QS_5_68_33]